MSQISVVIPMFNEARHIARTLRAVRQAAQAAQLDCEVIIADNGSSDQGPQIAREFGAQVLVLPGLVIGALRNRGAAVASGTWLAFIDADMEMPKNWFSLLLDVEARGQADVLALECLAPTQAPWFAQAWQRRHTHPDEPVTHRAQWLPTANLLMRRSWFEQVGGFHPTLRTGEDKELTMRLADAGARLMMVSQPIALHWGYEDSWGEWLGKEMWRQGSHLQLLRNHGASLRLLRFPLFAMAVWLLDLIALVALFTDDLAITLLFALLSALPALVLALRQGFKHRDLLFVMQLWGLHWIRLHLAGVAFVLNLCQKNARRPARG